MEKDNIWRKRRLYVQKEKHVYAEQVTDREDDLCNLMRFVYPCENQAFYDEKIRNDRKIAGKPAIFFLSIFQKPLYAIPVFVVFLPMLLLFFGNL